MLIGGLGTRDRGYMQADVGYTLVELNRAALYLILFGFFSLQMSSHPMFQHVAQCPTGMNAGTRFALKTPRRQHGWNPTLIGGFMGARTMN